MRHTYMKKPIFCAVIVYEIISDYILQQKIRHYIFFFFQSTKIPYPLKKNSHTIKNTIYIILGNQTDLMSVISTDILLLSAENISYICEKISCHPNLFILNKCILCGISGAWEQPADTPLAYMYVLH